MTGIGRGGSTISRITGASIAGATSATGCCTGHFDYDWLGPEGSHLGNHAHLNERLLLLGDPGEKSVCFSAAIDQA